MHCIAYVIAPDRRTARNRLDPFVGDKRRGGRYQSARLLDDSPRDPDDLDVRYRLGTPTVGTGDWPRYAAANGHIIDADGIRHDFPTTGTVYCFDVKR